MSYGVNRITNRLHNLPHSYTIFFLLRVLYRIHTSVLREYIVFHYSTIFRDQTAINQQKNGRHFLFSPQASNRAQVLEIADGKGSGIIFRHETRTVQTAINPASDGERNREIRSGLLRLMMREGFRGKVKQPSLAKRKNLPYQFYPLDRCLYFMRWGWSAVAPRRAFLSASYSE